MLTVAPLNASHNLENTDASTITISTKPAIFISTAQRNVNYDTPKTGDIDYAHSIVKELNTLQPNTASMTEGLYSEAEIYQYVLQQQNPILHVMLNPPFTGMAFTPEGLKSFREKGGRVVITAIEFAKFEGRENEYLKEYGIHPQKLILQFLEQADEAIFLDENDKKTALTALARAGKELASHSTASHINSVSNRRHVELFDLQNAKHQAPLINLMAHLNEVGRAIGTAYSEGDCFFDAIAQQLGSISLPSALQGQLQDQMHKSLRLLCNQAAKGANKWAWIRKP